MRHAAAPLRWLRGKWRRLRAWRRISFTTGGLVFTLGTFAVGFAALNTGNNLLYLLLGAMLGFIAVSGWLSEQVIRAVQVERHVPRAVTVGQDLRIGYHVVNHKAKLPTLAVELSEGDLPGRAFVAHVPPGGSTDVRSLNSFVRRGTYPLHTLTLSTSFPFGLFLKERDVEMPGEVVVWPRTDRSVRIPLPGGGSARRSGTVAQGAVGQRGEYRGLRSYRAGDDPRDIHWRSSARLPEPVLREYERDVASTRWICLDLRREPSEAAEESVEVAATLAARAARDGRPFALVAGDTRIDPGQGVGQLERVLDVLARVDFSLHHPPCRPPVALDTCIFVRAGDSA